MEERITSKPNQGAIGYGAIKMNIHFDLNGLSGKAFSNTTKKAYLQGQLGNPGVRKNE